MRVFHRNNSNKRNLCCPHRENNSMRRRKMITVIDAICGAGKTSWAIQYMKDKSTFGEKNFIYVTPFLEEIERVLGELPKFKQPDNKNRSGSKLEGLSKLIDSGSNIVCTHELFKMLDEEILESIRLSGYTLILDEVLNVINQIPIAKKDIDMLITSNKIKVNENSVIEWNDEDYEGCFSDLKILAKRQNLFIMNNTFMFWTLDKKAFKSFKNIFIMTYLFDGQIQKYYYDLHEFEYYKKSVIRNEDKYELVEYNPKHDNRERIAARLNIYQNSGKSKLNTNYCDKPTNNMFSSTWLKKCDQEIYKQLSNNVRAFLIYNKGNTKNSFWTTIKDVAPKIKNSRATYRQEPGKKHNFVPVNIRAVNHYKDCINAGYLFNRFMNPVEKAFFNYHDIDVDEDALAVSDLIQFLFRGCIRKQESEEIMNVYIPSIRMRNLLDSYLKYETYRKIKEKDMKVGVNTGTIIKLNWIEGADRKKQSIKRNRQRFVSNVSITKRGTVYG